MKMEKSFVTFYQMWPRKFLDVNVDCCLIGLDNLKISDSMLLFD